MIRASNPRIDCYPQARIPCYICAQGAPRRRISSITTHLPCHWSSIPLRITSYLTNVSLSTSSRVYNITPCISRRPTTFLYYSLIGLIKRAFFQLVSNATVCNLSTRHDMRRHQGNTAPEPQWPSQLTRSLEHLLLCIPPPASCTVSTSL